MTNGSLFSGIGGMDKGADDAGIKTKYFVEKEPYFRYILKKRFPGTLIYEDIKRINPCELPDTDILSGGFPCQDISQAKPNGLGLLGIESGLWDYYLNIITIKKPKYVFIENVANIRTKGLSTIRRQLTSLGYVGWHRRISARQFGFPDRRWRIFIVAANSDSIGCKKMEIFDKKFSEILLEKAKMQTLSSNELAGISGGEFWSEVYPRIVRIDNGFSNPMERIRGLGNAVKPILAEMIYRTIIEFDKFINNKIDNEVEIEAIEVKSIEELLKYLESVYRNKYELYY